MPGSTVARARRRGQSARLGLAGLGTVASAHLEAYAAMTDVDVVGGADPSPEARARAAELYGLPTFETVEELLESGPFDLLCILSPVRTHRSIVETAVRYRVPLLCEKPLAASVEDGAAIVEASASAEVPLAYGSSYRFLAPVRAAREAVVAGAIGTVALVVETLVGGAGRDAQRPVGPEHYPPGTPGGTPMGLVDHGIHFVDVAPWLVDQDVVSATGHGNTSGGSLRPEFLVLELDGGTCAHFLAYDGTWSTSLPNEGQWLAGGGWDMRGAYVPAGTWGRDLVELNVYGSDGALRIVPYGHRLYRTGPSGVVEIPLDGAPAPHHFGVQLRAVLDALDRGEPLPVPGQVGLQALRILHSVYEHERESLTSGGRHVD